MQIILLLGQRIRVGTNFVGSTLELHPDVVTIPPGQSRGELNLFRTRFIEQHHRDVISGSFAIGLTADQLEQYLPHYFDAWLRHIPKSYDLEKSDKAVFIKSPVIDNFDLWRWSLPNAKIAVLTRDGRDNVISSVRAANDKRQWNSVTKTARKRVNYYSGRSFVQHCKDWKRTAAVFQAIREDEMTQKFQYEDLNGLFECVKKLLQFFDLRSNEEIVNRCLRAPVIGSSWGIDDGRTRKPNWTPDYEKGKYQFSNKWRDWGLVRKTIFKKIAGNELIDLGYVESNEW